MMDTHGKFYLGRKISAERGISVEEPLLYDPSDLTTHAVVVGMTGSGKTGLCISMLEEAALQGIPALMIDPKGDITNSLLHFPTLSAQDFEPWVDPDQARREGKTLEQAANQAAQSWRNGLAEWDIPAERLSALKNAVQFAIFTPGSDIGIPVSILASLKAPGISWEGNHELLREKISSTVTALLGLVGFSDIDPVRSREHILLANIFENAWSEGKDLDLEELILQVQSPPFPKLGVFDVDQFFPEKDRFNLAMVLNNILAAPAFQSWIEGQPLDIATLLYTEDGRPRHSVFYIAHLSDTERMFFVTLLYSAVESWMRSQAVTAGLRAIGYFDEIFALPHRQSSQTPVAAHAQTSAPWSWSVLTLKPGRCRLQGTPNAVPFIGKLQTEQIRSGFWMAWKVPRQVADRGEYDRHFFTGKKSSCCIMSTNHIPDSDCWAMNYLAGPLTRIKS
jgi:hypothetical protein